MRRSQALLATVALALAPRSVAAQTKDTLRVAFPILDPTAEVLYGIDMGFFDRAGLDIEPMPLVNGAAIVAGVAGGSLDIGHGNTLTIELAFKRGLPITIIAPGSAAVTAAPVNALYVVKSSALQKAADLNGKVIGVSPLGGIGQVCVEAWMDKNGGDASTVKFIEVPFPHVESILIAGRADAAMGSEPFITQSKATTRMLANVFAAVGDGILVTAFFATLPWARANAAVVARFDATIRQIGAWANKNPDASAAILAKYAKMDPSIVRASTRAHFATTLTSAQLQPTIDASAKYNVLDAPFPAHELILQPQ